MRRWFITGVSSGIGRALAAAALERGDVVAGTVRAQGAVADFEALAAGRALGFALDVDRTNDIAPVVSRAIAAAGGVDIVVNNAGRSLFGAIEETGVEETRALFETNLFAPLAVMQAFLPHFRARGSGRFVNMSSGCGLTAVPGVGVYSATKFALEGLSEALALECAPFGVGVTIVEPGAVQTRFISHGTADTVRRMAEYEALSGGGKAALDAYYQTCAVSPESVADAILNALDRPQPPARLIVGDDVRHGARAKFADLLTLMDAS